MECTSRCGTSIKLPWPGTLLKVTSCTLNVNLIWLRHPYKLDITHVMKTHELQLWKYVPYKLLTILSLETTQRCVCLRWGPSLMDFSEVCQTTPWEQIYLNQNLLLYFHQVCQICTSVHSILPAATLYTKQHALCAVQCMCRAVHGTQNAHHKWHMPPQYPLIITM